MHFSKKKHSCTRRFNVALSSPLKIGLRRGGERMSLPVERWSEARRPSFFSFDFGDELMELGVAAHFTKDTTPSRYHNADDEIALQLLELRRILDMLWATRGEGKKRWQWRSREVHAGQNDVES